MTWLLQASGISNSAQCQECCRMAQVEHNIVIAICTSLMRRIHRKHPFSGKLCLGSYIYVLGDFNLDLMKG